MCAVHAGDNTNELTLPEQGDKIFNSPDYNIVGRIIDFEIENSFGYFFFYF